MLNLPRPPADYLREWMNQYTRALELEDNALWNAVQAAQIDIDALEALRLTGNLTLYVRTDGSDSNTGKTDSAAGAFATWQAAVNLALTFNFNFNDVIIKAGEEGAPKTWNLGGSPIVVRAIIGFGGLYFRPSTSGTTLTGTFGNFFISDILQTVFIGGLTLTGTGGYGLISVNGKSTVQLDPLGGPTFGSHDVAHVWVHDNQALVDFLNGSYRISGSALYHMIANNGGAFALENCTVTISAPITVSTFVQASNNGTIQSTLCTFVNPGNVTGVKFSAVSGGIINTLGNGINYFPGTIAGLIFYPGIYNDVVATVPVLLQAGFLSLDNCFINKANPQITLDKAASGEISSLFGKHSGIARWEAALGNATAEAGANAGSDFSLYAYGDAGAFIGQGLGIERKTLNAQFSAQLTVLGLSVLIGGVYSTGDATVAKANPLITGDKAASGQSSAFWGKLGGVARWEIVAGDTTAEAGANAGSNFALNSYGDAGAFVGTALSVNRATMISTFGSEVVTTASSTTRAGLNLPHGTAPTSPVNGDLWTTTTGLFARINGATVGPLS